MSESATALARALAERYTIERELGRGGMALVYLAQDRKLGRHVALKVLRPELAAALGPDRFLREMAIAARLSHPNILPLHDRGDAAGQLYYTMPFVEGESLRDRLTRERQLPIADAVRIATEVADALSHAHVQGIIHRDIKPENILFQAGHAVVSDFGIARAIAAAGDETLTETGLAVGTPAYMSPEQATGEKELDARSDIYSLGCVVYEMLSGEPPFTGASVQALVAKKLSEPTPRVSVVREFVPASLETALHKALAKTPADRFATASRFAEALKRDRESGELLASRSWRRRVVAIALVLVTVVGAVGALSWVSASGLFGGPASPAANVPRRSGATLALLPFEAVGGDSSTGRLSQGITEELRSSLSDIHGLEIRVLASPTRDEGEEGTPFRIARDVDADVVVEGSVLVVGGKARIIAHLRVAATGRQIWSDTYDGDLSDVLAFLSHAARSVAAQVEVALTREDEERLASPPTTTPQVMQAVLLARYALQGRTPDGLKQSERRLQQALDLDPAFAPAWGLLARVEAVGAYWFWGSELTEDVILRAERAARRALALDDRDVDAQVALGMTSQLRRHWVEAEERFRAVISRDPSNAFVGIRLANLLTWMGRYDEAETLARQVVQFNPLSVDAHAEVANVLAEAGRVREAFAEMRAAHDLDPTDWLPRAFLVGYLVAMGHCEGSGDLLADDERIGDAVGEVERFLSANPAADSWRLSAAAQVFVQCGRRDRALDVSRVLDARAETAYVSPAHRVRARVAAGRMGGVIKLLRQGLHTNDAGMVTLTNGNGFQALRDSLGGNPQFEAIVDSLALPRSPLKWPGASRAAETTSGN